MKKIYVIEAKDASTENVEWLIIFESKDNAEHWIKETSESDEGDFKDYEIIETFLF